MMKTKLSNLGLTIPIPTPGLRAMVEPNPESIKIWRALLPMADIGGTAKKLFDLLQNINCLVIDSEARYQIMELYRQPLQYILTHLNKHYLHQIRCLTERQVRVIELAESLQTNMAYGYKLVIDDLLTKKLFQQEPYKTIFRHSIYRLLQNHFSMIVRRSEIYDSVNQRIWVETFLLYKLASKNEMVDQDVYGNKSDGSRKTINNIYKQILLLSSFPPFSFRQNELINAAPELKEWAKLVKIEPLRKLDAAPKVGYFLIDFDKPEPPRFVPKTQYKDFTIPQYGHALDCSELIEKFNQIINASSSTASMQLSFDKIPIYVYKRLVHNWSENKIRKQPRSETKDDVTIVIGLSSVHHFISGENEFDLHKSIVSGDDNNKGEENIETLDTIELTNVIDDTEGSIIVNTKYDDPIGFNKHRCTITDISVNGYRINWSKGRYPPIQPGDILGLHRPETAYSQWSIGSIRWVRSVEENKTRLGVEIISDCVRPVGAHPLREGNKSASYALRCLLVYEKGYDEQPIAIITPNIPFVAGQRIGIYYEHEDIPQVAVISVERETTGSYKIFSIQFEENKNPGDLANGNNMRSADTSAAKNKVIRRDLTDIDSSSYSDIGNDLDSAESKVKESQESSSPTRKQSIDDGRNSEDFDSIWPDL